MSFPSRSDHSNRTRFSNQNARQTWVPKGSSQNVVETPPSNFNSNPNGAGGRNPNNAASSRGRNNRPKNQKNERGRSHNQEVMESKNPILPQLVHEIQEKLVKGTVECMICYDMVRRSASIWSCSSCYSIFHLHCIKKWARAPTSSDFSAETNQGFNWRCPGCQSVQLTSSKEIHYACFCGNRTNPPSDLYLTPHSCGEPCGKQLEKAVQNPSENKEDLCPHRCVLQCHPGPCPPCKAFAPPRRCPCGKKVMTTRCSDRSSVPTCGQSCDKLLECSHHQCEKTCHVGPCDPCRIPINASCFCKKKTEVLLCGNMSLKGEVKAEEGVFSCNSTCEKMLDCGNHICGEKCHPGPCRVCELMPGKVNSCHCGKTSLQVERNSCLDPIANCSLTCGKLLPCGVHQCKELCHGGDCPPCLLLVTQKCRCGSTSRTIQCYKTSEKHENFTCEKPCGRKKNCGRHRCSERCCPLSNPKNVNFTDFDPHFCQIHCGKKLRCGQHNCENLCHSGHCPPCLETIFTDLSCACGKTSIPPPLPCGTPIPLCQLTCSVAQPCGHTATHSCHIGDCPPCSFPIAKECVGGHVILGNIPCGSKEIRCNKLCGKTRQCGLHACVRTCHSPPCDNLSITEFVSISRASCGQPCGAPRRDCRHTCNALCHPFLPCPDARCEFPETITCSCGRISTPVPCGNGGFDSDTVFEASIAQNLPAPLQPTELACQTKIPLGQRKLLCDDECAKKAQPSLEALCFGENDDGVAELYRRDSKWVLAVEDRCKYLVLGKNRGPTTTTTDKSLKVHIFCPMVKDNRDAVRLIAERWKLAIYAAGWEPKRFIVARATPKSKAPSRLVTGIDPPDFDPLVDMDPRLVVLFRDLPREANPEISSLVLRFGGECELVWLDDKNALAVFNDPARAATAMRRLEYGSVYCGAILVIQQSIVNGSSGGNRNWKRAVARDSWGGGEEWGKGFIDVQASAWRGKEASVSASVNRWNVLDSESGGSSSSNAENLDGIKTEGFAECNGSFSNSGTESGASISSVVDDWEKACDSENI